MIGKKYKIIGYLKINIFNQVEVNIGQVGGPGCATLMSKLHKRMIEKVGNLRYGQPLSSTVNGKLPENCPRKGMAEAMLHAWKLFGDKNV